MTIPIFAVRFPELLASPCLVSVSYWRSLFLLSKILCAFFLFASHLNQFRQLIKFSFFRSSKQVEIIREEVKIKSLINIFKIVSNVVVFLKFLTLIKIFKFVSNVVVFVKFLNLTCLNTIQKYLLLLLQTAPIYKSIKHTHTFT